MYVCINAQHAYVHLEGVTSGAAPQLLLPLSRSDFIPALFSLCIQPFPADCQNIHSFILLPKEIKYHKDPSISGYVIIFSLRNHRM